MAAASYLTTLSRSKSYFECAELPSRCTDRRIVLATLPMLLERVARVLADLVLGYVVLDVQSLNLSFAEQCVCDEALRRQLLAWGYKSAGSKCTRADHHPDQAHPLDRTVFTFSHDDSD